MMNATSNMYIGLADGLTIIPGVPSLILTAEVLHRCRSFLKAANLSSLSIYELKGINILTSNAFSEDDNVVLELDRGDVE
jgi:hypothetical protein